VAAELRLRAERQSKIWHTSRLLRRLRAVRPIDHKLGL